VAELLQLAAHALLVEVVALLGEIGEERLLALADLAQRPLRHRFGVGSEGDRRKGEEGRAKEASGAPAPGEVNKGNHA